MMSMVWDKYANRARLFRYYIFDRYLFYMFDIYRKLQKKDALTRIVNEKEIRIYGLRRSGNHGIIRWLLGHMTDNFIFLNNVKLNINPFRSRYYDFKESYLWREVLGDFTDKKCLVYSYEDHDLSRINHKFINKWKALHTGLSKEVYDILILRDPFNMYASRMKGYQEHDFMTVKSKKNVLELWLDYAKEYLGETSYLVNKKIVINYNRWFVDKKYRESIANLLGFAFTDKGFGHLEGFSSFSGRLNINARELDVFSRWKHFIRNENYINDLNQQNILNYCNIIFPEMQCFQILEELGLKGS